MPVEETWSQEKVSYWFRMAKPLLAASKFEWGEHGSSEMRDEKNQVLRDAYGRPQFVGIPGGHGYWFYLRDFSAVR